MSSPAQNVAFDPVLLDLFRTELQTHGRVLEEGLVNAEADQSANTLEPLIRAAHSIKGAARMLNLNAAVRLAHAMEDVLVAAQRGSEPLTAACIDALLRGNDVFVRAAAGPAASVPAELDKRADEIDMLIADLTPPQTAPPARIAPEASDVAPQTVPPPAAIISTARAEARANSAGTAEESSVRVSAESLNRLLGLAGECLVLTRLTTFLTSGIQAMKQRDAATARRVERALEYLTQGDTDATRVELDQVLNHLVAAAELAAQHLLEVADWNRRLDVLVNKLYSEAVASRMRPFSDGVHGFPRMVRDLARDLGKKVRLEIDGASTPVDRDILDRLEAPLTHLIRNAIDHGVETPGVRVAAGKREEAQITLSAHQASGMLRVAVSDDGAGIHFNRLRNKVVASGYVSEAMSRDLEDSELLNFLFLPGFSTADAVTQVSGRGVGLDVVHAMVRAVGGSVRMKSIPSAGTTVEMQLPLTLSVVRALLVDVAGEIYAIPLTRIDRLVRRTLRDVETIEDRQFCRIDGESVGILDAAQVLHAATRPPSENIPLVLISDRMSRYGLVVDRFLGECDLVVKPLPASLGKIPNIGSGAILDDGTPVLILDPDDLVRSMDNLVKQASLRKVYSSDSSMEPRPRRRVLVVDDSLTVREVERRLLESSGYQVAVSIDGADAWNLLQRASFDLLVTDVDMPRMDGFELVRRVRATPRTAALPVIIVSYKENPEYRTKGMEAGANYYLGKSSFHDDSLVGAVRDLIGVA